MGQAMAEVDGPSREYSPEGNGMAEEPILKPGEEAPISAQYLQVGPHGGDTGKEVTVPKGHRLPPTDKPGQGYRPVDPTKNKSGRR